MKYRVTGLSLTQHGNSVITGGNLERSSDGVSWQTELTLNITLATSTDPVAFRASLINAVMAVVQQDMNSVAGYLENLRAEFEGKVFTV